MSALNRALGANVVVAVELKPIPAQKPPNWRLARTTPPLTPHQWLFAFDAIVPLTMRYTMASETPLSTP